MFDAEQVAKTTQRYEERTPERAGTEAKLAAGAVLEVDTPDRVHSRLVRKGIDPTVAAEVLSGDLSFATTTEMPRVLNTLERIIGADDLINATFLSEGARVSRAVCRIEIGVRNGLVAGYGTGVLISPRLVLTNNHVLDSAASAAASHIEFGYEDDDEGRLQPFVRFALDPDTFFVTDPELDYTVVAVNPASENGQPLDDFGWVPLIEQQGKAIKGEYVNIIQHPNGEPKRLALRENQIVDLLENFLHYKTDTAPGSSGAPVFNDEWEMVALHHSGVPARDAQGNFLAIDGSLWSEEMGEHRVKWVANEGARVSRLVRRLREQNLDDARRRLLDAVFSAAGSQPSMPTPASDEPRRGIVIERPPVTPVTSDTGSDEASTPVVANDTVTWTIPIQISVRLGAATTATPIVTVAQPAAGSSATVTTPASTGTASNRLSEALAELERARALPYYSKVTDDAAREAYYLGLPEQRQGAEFFTALHELLTRTHTATLRYDPSRHVYPWVDLRPNKKLRSIYTGQEYEPEVLIQEDFRVEEARAARLRERFGAEAAITDEALDTLEALLPYNCEHVVPQSWYSKREPMRGDLHHLFACESRCNSFRGNTPYFEFPQFEEAVRQGCGMR
ncbi:MAG: trypsin-like peptidase domain-containing protein, partial [Thermomicrobiales bacterium]